MPTCSAVLCGAVARGEDSAAADGCAAASCARSARHATLAARLLQQESDSSPGSVRTMSSVGTPTVSTLGTSSEQRLPAGQDTM